MCGGVVKILDLFCGAGGVIIDVAKLDLNGKPAAAPSASEVTG